MEEIIAYRRGHSGRITGIIGYDDRIYTASLDGSLRVWEKESLRELGSIIGIDKPIYGLCGTMSNIVLRLEKDIVIVDRDSLNVKISRFDRPILFMTSWGNRIILGFDDSVVVLDDSFKNVARIRHCGCIGNSAIVVNDVLFVIGRGWFLRRIDLSSSEVVDILIDSPPLDLTYCNNFLYIITASGHILKIDLNGNIISDSFISPSFYSIIASSNNYILLLVILLVIYFF